jgi:hypothetical protein
MTSSDLVDGLVGKAIDFDGVDDYINCGNSNVLNPTNEITIEALTSFNYIDSNSKYSLLSRDDNSVGRSYNLFIYLGERELQINGAATIRGGSNISLVQGQYYHMCATGNSTSGYIYYMDSIIDGSATWVTPNSTTGNTLLSAASYTGAESYANVSTSEIRISNIARSADWIKTTNNTLRDNLTTIQKADIYNITGYVKELGQPVQRLVCLYDRTSGELIDKIMSLSTGYYTLKTTSSGLHNLVCYDAKAAPDFDDLLISKVTPSEIIK